MFCLLYYYFKRQVDNSEDRVGYLLYPKILLNRYKSFELECLSRKKKKSLFINGAQVYGYAKKKYNNKIAMSVLCECVQMCVMIILLAVCIYLKKYTHQHTSSSKRTHSHKLYCLLNTNTTLTFNIFLIQNRLIIFQLEIIRIY